MALASWTLHRRSELRTGCARGALRGHRELSRSARVGRYVNAEAPRRDSDRGLSRIPFCEGHIDDRS
jgi:hypothetical protein